MKKLALAAAVVLVMVLLSVAGCSPDAEPAAGEVTSTCVICHSDKDLLKQTATMEQEEKSEETSGEG